MRDSGLSEPLVELAKIPLWQVNSCTFCLDVHYLDARAAGKDQRRHDCMLSAWREAPELFSEAEQSALAFTKAVTH